MLTAVLALILISYGYDVFAYIVPMPMEDRIVFPGSRELKPDHMTTSLIPTTKTPKPLPSRRGWLEDFIQDDIMKTEREEYVEEAKGPYEMQNEIIESEDSVLKLPLKLADLLDMFLTLQSEISSKIYSAYLDHKYLISDVFKYGVKKFTRLFDFVSNGVKIIRKVLRFAIELFAQWDVELPPITQALKPLFLRNQAVDSDENNKSHQEVNHDNSDSVTSNVFEHQNHNNYSLPTRTISSERNAPKRN